MLWPEQKTFSILSNLHQNIIHYGDEEQALKALAKKYWFCCTKAIKEYLKHKNEVLIQFIANLCVF